MQHAMSSNRIRSLLIILVSISLAPILTPGVFGSAPAEKSVDAPNGIRVLVKMIGPVTQTTDLQIICVLKHHPGTDKYIEAMSDFNNHLGGLLASLRDRGEFAGDSGETLLFTPPVRSIVPARVLLIGVGEESGLTVEQLGLAGRIALREAVRLNAVHVSFAPALRDQGSDKIDVGDGDGTVVQQFLLAYDTQKRLESQSLSPRDQLADFTIEAGPKYYNAAVDKVSTAVALATSQIKQRSSTPYQSAGGGN